MIINKPLITLIVPVYNCEKYLDECLQSLISQDYSNIEIILINDGSTDSSGEIAKRYQKKDNRIKLVEQKNSGVSAARNKGIELATGRYITFIDSDDYVEKDYISYLYNLMKDNKVDISLSLGVRKFNKIGEKKKTGDKSECNTIVDGKEATENLLYYKINVSPFNKLISRDFINKNNIRFEKEIAYGEDFIFNIESFINCKCVAIGDKIIYNYRVDNENSAMTKLKPRLIKDNIKAQKIIKDKVEKKYMNLENALHYAKWHTYCDCINTIIGCNAQKEYKQDYNIMKKVCRNDSMYGIKANISKKEKIKCFMYLVSPFLAAKIINHFMIRKFTSVCK